MGVEPLLGIITFLVMTTVGTLAGVARMIYTGKLVPAATLERERAISAKWEAAYFAEAERVQLLAGPVAQILAAVSKSTGAAP